MPWQDSLIDKLFGESKAMWNAPSLTEELMADTKKTFNQPKLVDQLWAGNATTTPIGGVGKRKKKNVLDTDIFGG